MSGCEASTHPETVQVVTLQNVVSEAFQDPEFRQHWERLAPARAVANSVIAYRARHGLTQTALARVLGISQPAVARLEIAEHLPTLDTLLKLSERLGPEFSLTLAPASQTDSSRDRLPIEERIVTAAGASLAIAVR